MLQVVLGQALHGIDELLPSSSLPFDDTAAAVLLVFFGIKTLQVSPPKMHIQANTCIVLCLSCIHKEPDGNSSISCLSKT